jgi:UTP-glucose-1-phosphate uridylyltransferase
MFCYVGGYYEENCENMIMQATKSQPKEMLPKVDKPTLLYIIEEAIASGIEEILIVTGRINNRF